MNCFVIKFKNRDAHDISNQCLNEIYTKGPKFDVDLISSDNKIVSAHKFVVFIFSKYLKDYLCEFKAKGKICVPLPEYSTFVLQQVIDLFYNGQIMVGAEVKPRIEKALQFLKVEDIIIQNAATQSNSTLEANVSASTSSIMQAKCLSTSVPNLQMSQMYKRELSSDSIRYNNSQAVKRQRPQSVYTENPSRAFGETVNVANPVQLNSQQQYRIGSVSISKATGGASTSKSIPMMQPDMQIYAQSIEDMDIYTN